MLRDFEGTIEQTLLDLHRRFRIQSVRFDPFQMASTSQRLERARLKMVEFPQTLPNLTEASSNLYELIKSQNLIVYPDDQIRLAISRAVALETSRGWRITKEKTSHKIDCVVAMAMSALGAVADIQKKEVRDLLAPVQRKAPQPLPPGCKVIPDGSDLSLRHRWTQ